MKKQKVRIAVFASGNGTNFEAIIKAVKTGFIKADLSLLVSDNPQAYAIERARRAGVESVLIQREACSSRADFESHIIAALKKRGINLIVLAGFMRILSADFIKKYRLKVINIHPALLPAFKGAHGIKDAFEYGVKVSGVTVHFVDEKTDHGPIILQASVEVKENDTIESLAKRIHKAEHALYPQAIRLFVEGKLRVRGRRVQVVTARASF